MAEQGEAYAPMASEDVAALRAAVKAGDHVSIEQVKAWIDSWGTSNEFPMPTPSER